jgi:hypothetical protein
MPRTYEQILTFANAARGYLERSKGQKTKLAYAIERVMKGYETQTTNLETAYRDKLEDIEIEHCSVDDRGNIISPYVFTKEAQRARLKARKEASAELLKSEVDVTPYMATQIPDDLTEAEREAFAGFVVEEFEAELAEVPQ